MTVISVLFIHKHAVICVHANTCFTHIIDQLRHIHIHYIGNFNNKKKPMEFPARLMEV